MKQLIQKTRALNYFGIYLILAGVAGYLSNPEKAKTALYSGSLFGLLMLACGFLSSKNKTWAVKVGLGLCLMLAVVFSWRATAGWMAVYNGNNDKLFAAALISSMLLGALITLKILWNKNSVART